MLTQICYPLRDMLQIDPTLKTSLKEEIAHAQQYLSIEQVRMGSRLRFVCEVAEGLDAALVPGVLLQSMVENAVRHGIAQSGRSGEVHIRASRDRDGLWITIENTGSRSAEESNGHGIGLANRRERLATLYGCRCLRVSAALPSSRCLTTTSISDTFTSSRRRSTESSGATSGHSRRRTGSLPAAELLPQSLTRSAARPWLFLFRRSPKSGIPTRPTAFANAASAGP